MEYGQVDELVRAETSSVQDVALWQEMRHAPDIEGIVSPLRSMQSSAVVTVCLFSGTFVTPVGPPAPDGSVPPPHDRLRLLVSADGSVRLDAAGYRGRLAPETPSDWKRGA
jgi:hypothetical protein